MASIYGISAYQQTNSTWKTESKKTEQSGKSTDAETTSAKTSANAKLTEWKPLANTSPLIPKYDSEYGNVIGNVSLSDEGREYYDKLKAKYHGMDFILVDTSIKGQVAKNAAAYGNANKPVVLIDAEKIEKMATDESFRKKYEGIIAMSQLQLAEAKNSLASSGAAVKNFGMSVDSNGKTSFFATLEKTSENNKALAEKQAAKKAAKAKEKKVAEKKAKEAKLEEKRAEKKAAEKEAEEAVDEAETAVEMDDKEYVMFNANSMDELRNKVSKYAYRSSEKQILTETEKTIGQRFDSKM